MIPRVSPKRRQSIPPIGVLFDRSGSFEEVIASDEVIPSELVTPPSERETAPGEETAPEETVPEETAPQETAPGETAPEEPAPEEETALGEETALTEETTPGEATAPGEETAPEEKIPDCELLYIDSSKWGSHNRTKIGSRKFLDFIRERVPVSQTFTVNNHRDFKNQMTRSTLSPVVLKQAI